MIMQNEYQRLLDGLSKLDEKVDRMQVEFIDRTNLKADRAELSVMHSEIKLIKSVSDGKVTYKQFYWILTFVCTILIGVLGYIVQRLDEASGDISFIRGKFAQVDNVVIEDK